MSSEPRRRLSDAGEIGYKEPMQDLVFLSAPYDANDPACMEAVSRAVARLLAGGQYVVTPLLNHYVFPYGDLPRTWEFWGGFARTLLDRCARLVVLRLPGWDRAEAVVAEIAHAEAMGIPCDFIDP